MDTFFYSKVEKIYKELPEFKDESPTKRLQQHLDGKDLHFALRPVSVQHVRKIIQKMKPSMSAGYIDLPQKLKKHASENLCVPLQTIVNQSTPPTPGGEQIVATQSKWI